MRTPTAPASSGAAPAAGGFRAPTDDCCMIPASMLIRRCLRREYALSLLGAVLGVTGATLFLASVDGAALSGTLASASWWLAIPVLILGCVNFWLRTMRWGVLLGPRVGLRTSQLLGIGLKAGLVGLLLPARGGDLVKLALAVRLPSVSVAQLAAAELLERCVDGVVLGAFVTGSALAIGDRNWLLLVGLLALGIHGPVFAALPLAGRLRQPAHDHASGSWIRSLLLQAVEAVRQTDRSRILCALGLSALAWCAQALACYFVAIAFGWLPSPALPLATVGVTNFAFGLPGAPAGLGTVEFPMRHLMDRFDAEPGLASAYPMVMHLAVLAPLPVLWLLMHAVRFRSVRLRSSL